MSGFNEVTTADAYTAATTLEEPMTALTIVVYDAPVFYQLARGNPPYFDANSEHKIPPGMTAGISEPCTGVRVRSANKGQPAKVTVIASGGVS